MDLFDLHGKVAIVTGGNGGLGRGMASGLASAGADAMPRPLPDPHALELFRPTSGFGLACVTVAIGGRA